MKKTKDVRFQKNKSWKKTQNDTFALETRKRGEVKAVSLVSDFVQSNLFHVAKRKKKEGKKKIFDFHKKWNNGPKQHVCPGH